MAPVDMRWNVNPITHKPSTNTTHIAISIFLRIVCSVFLIRAKVSIIFYSKGIVTEKRLKHFTIINNYIIFAAERVL